LVASGDSPGSATLRPASTTSPTLACTQLDPRLAEAKPSTQAFAELARQSLEDGCVAYIDTSTSPPSLELAFLRGSLTGTVINIGPLRTASGSVDLTDVALTSSGALYGVDFSSDLYRIDTANAVATLIGPLSAEVNGLVVSPEGTLYASGGYELYTVNLTSGSATNVGTTGYASSGDLAFAPDGTLLMSAEPSLGGPNDSIVKLGLSTAYGTLIGSIGQGSVYGLGESYGTLFAATASGELLTVDPSTGASTVLAAGGDLSANGMAVPPQATAAVGRTPSAVPSVAITSSRFFTRGGSERGSVVLSCAHVSCSGVVRLTRVVGSVEGSGAPSNKDKKTTHIEVMASTRYELPQGATRAFLLTFTALGSRLARQGPNAVQGTLVVSVKGGPYATSGVDVTTVPTKTSSSSTTTTTLLLNQQQAARTLSALLIQSVIDRSEINAASNDVTSCGPTLSQDSQTFDTAASSRQSLITQLSSLPGVSALPPQVVQSLTSAWQASEQVDEDYASWASNEFANGCVPNDTSNTYYQDADAPNQEATTDKQTFAKLWNPIATKYGLTTYQWNQL
jgi:hypothetical protein